MGLTQSQVTMLGQSTSPILEAPASDMMASTASMSALTNSSLPWKAILLHFFVALNEMCRGLTDASWTIFM